MPNFYHALVTGASSGIGEAISRLLSSNGIALTISGRNVEKLENLAKELPNTKILPADLATGEGRDKVRKAIETEKYDLVINNAGFGIYGDAADLPIDKQVESLIVNSQAVLELTLAAINAMRKSGCQGTVVNISSAASFFVLPGMAVYTATKAFVTNFSEALDFENEKHGIRVLASCPGVVATDFRKRAGGPSSYPRGTMTQEYAAEQVWKQIGSGQRVRVFNWHYRFLAFISRHLIPTSLSAKMAYKGIQKDILLTD